jgi:hypothetical protein
MELSSLLETTSTCRSSRRRLGSKHLEMTITRAKLER